MQSNYLYKHMQYLSTLDWNTQRGIMLLILSSVRLFVLWPNQDAELKMRKEEKRGGQR